NNDFRNIAWVDDANGSHGIGTGITSHDNVIRGNKIHDIGLGQQPNASWSAYCISLAGTGTIIEDNELYGCTGLGIHMYGAGPPPPDANTIRRNYIHDNGGTAVLVCGAAASVHNNIIAHNGIGTGVNTGRDGISVAGYCESAKVDNGKIYNNTIY